MNLRLPRKGYREKIWDHCAGALIVQEAGGTISDAAGACSCLAAGRKSKLITAAALWLAYFCPTMQFCNAMLALQRT